ncbi:MAG TPA: hypothetical protein PK052_06185 [Anaerohalosphaeraceae bacterium]|nr:hypothetical protein [Anaerohalosphaeraceae bacterium]HOL31557.1 hypothetical protein [Anaerohalosphaeraceae bacterium]HOM75984.1 hypothetical protein [Anaerohalosphaeraceae bacterium]HPC63775.1 hypothetical protein [Anaerohalosphaeraceae bacterium]HPO69840.1 hypothetical protein [Anaerohalosphaeraceae bacterium]
MEKVKQNYQGSSLLLPAHGRVGARETSTLVAHFAKQNTKFGSDRKRGRAKIPSPQPPSFLPARAFQFCARSAQSFGIMLKKCSNFRIADRTLVLDFKKAFKIAEKYHAEALCAETIPCDFTKSEKAERAGFEPAAG